MVETIQTPVGTIQPLEASAPAAAPVFDTVIERIVTNAFSFKTGGQRGVTWTDGKKIDISDKEEFLQKYDIDLFTDDGRILYGLDLKIIPADWSAPLSYEEMSQRLQSTNRYTLYGLAFGPQIRTPVCWFETRKGLKGILQVTGFTENPRGVKIRYKLVQPETANTNDIARDFVAVLPQKNEAAVHDACLRFVFARHWIPFENWNPGGMALKTADNNGKSVTFTLSRQTNSTTSFTINAELGASVSAMEIGAQLGINQLVQIQAPATTTEKKIKN